MTLRCVISLWSFHGVKAFDFFNGNGFSCFFETKIWLLYLIHMTVILGWCSYFSMIYFEEFASAVVTSLKLHASVHRFGTMLTKNSFNILASAFWDVIIVDSSIREIVLHVLTLLPNTGFTVFQKLFASVTLCKSKFSRYSFLAFFNKKTQTFLCFLCSNLASSDFAVRYLLRNLDLIV